jgi:hypothetical protein
MDTQAVLSSLSEAMRALNARNLDELDGNLEAFITDLEPLDEGTQAGLHSEFGRLFDLLLEHGIRCYGNSRAGLPLWDKMLRINRFLKPAM